MEVKKNESLWKDWCFGENQVMDGGIRQKSTNELLEGVAWGIYIIIFGVGWLFQELYQSDLNYLSPIVIGTILLGLNLARAGVGIDISKDSLAIGAVCAVVGGANILGFAIPLIPAIAVLVGVSVAIQALQYLTK